MVDQVQQLIDRIRKDAVDTAKGEAAQVQQQAREEAKRMVDAADARARSLVSDAESRAAAIVERGEKALEQASRDLLITVGQRLQTMIDSLLVIAAKDALRTEVVEEMLLRLCEGLAKSGLDEKGITLSVGPSDHARVAQFAVGRLREALGHGAVVHVDQQLTRGFRVEIGKDAARHDFTPEAIAATLSQFVRPQLGELIQRAALGPAARKP